MNKELLSKAGAVLTPIGVSLRTSNISIHPEFQPKHTESELGIRYKAHHLPQFKMMVDAKNDAFVVFQYEAGVRLIDTSVDEDSEDYLKVEVSAIFSSEYKLTDADSFDEAAMVEFLRHNVRHHVWPYWREYLQSTCMRMGLPPVPVPHQFYGQDLKEED